MIHLRYVTGVVREPRKMHDDLTNAGISVFGVSTQVDAKSAVTMVHVEDKISEEQKKAVDDIVRKAEKIEISESPVDPDLVEMPSTEERT